METCNYKIEVSKKKPFEFHLTNRIISKNFVSFKLIFTFCDIFLNFTNAFHFLKYVTFNKCSAIMNSPIRKATFLCR